MKVYLKYIFIILTCGLSFKSYTQSFTVTEDEKLDQIVLEAEKLGMSLVDFHSFVKTKGFSDQQLKILINKFEKKSTNSANSFELDRVGQPYKSKFLISDNDSTSITKDEKKIFGMEIFGNKGLNFSPNLNMATPQNYVVGPSDDLIIQIYGLAQLTLNLKVTNEGKIIVPNVGLFHVGGLTIEAINSLLTKEMGKRYAGLGSVNPSSFLQVTLANVRTININIVGDVKSPGTFQLPSFTNVFNALYSSGGPNKNGSFREIKLFRAGRLIKNVDLYDFLLFGITDDNVRLEDGDVLFVPNFIKRVEIVGEVRRSLFFEITDDESVSDLIRMANGFKETAYRNRVIIERFSSKEKKILNVDSVNFSGTALEDGDVVSISKIMDTYENRIQLIGAVMHPGDYEVIENERISDVLRKAGGLRKDAFLDRAILYRSAPDLTQKALEIDLNKVLTGDLDHDFLVKREDVILIKSHFDLKEIYYVSVEGEVNKSGIFPYFPNMTIGDLILTASGLKQSSSGSYIEVVRRVQNSLTEYAKVIKIDINSDLSFNQDQFNLQPFDEVYVRPSIGYKPLSYVYAQGETRLTGKFVINNSSLKVSDLLNRAGGILPSANVKGGLLIRKSLFFKPFQNEDFNLTRLKELEGRIQDTTISSLSEANRIFSNQIKEQISVLENLKKKDSLTNSSEKDRFDFNEIENIKINLQKSIFSSLNDVVIKESEYQFVSINLEKIINNPGGNDDILLREGDILYVPTLDETVTVLGEVLYPVSVKYEPDFSFKEFVSRAGGFTSKALRKRSYVVEANGSVLSTKNFLGIPLYPKTSAGSYIFIPKDSKQRSPLNIDRILGLTASLITTYLLISNLNN